MLGVQMALEMAKHGEGRLAVTADHFIRSNDSVLVAFLGLSPSRGPVALLLPRCPKVRV